MSASDPAQARALKAHILLVIVTLIWGTTFVINKAALNHASPLTFNAVRMTLAALVLAIFYRRSLAAIRPPALWAGTITGIFLFLGYELQITGLRTTTPSKSAFVTSLSAILVPVVLLVFWKTSVPFWRAAGIVAAFAGLFLLTLPPEVQSIAALAGVNRGDLLALGCAFAFAFQIVTLGRATQVFPFEQIAVLQIAVAAVLMIATAPVLETPRLDLSPVLLAAIVVTGLFGTALAFTIQAWAQQFTPATHAALIFTLEPVFAWLTAYAVLNEKLGMRAAAGAFLILGGVLMSELLGAKKLRSGTS